MKRTRLGDILLDMGAVDELQLQSALAHQRQWGTPLGRAVVEKRFCSASQVLEALSRQTGLRTLDLDREQLASDLCGLIPRRVAEQHRMVPLKLEGARREVLVVAIAAPASLASFDAAAAISGKSRVVGLLASDEAIDRAILRLYDAQVAPRRDCRARPDPVLLYGWPEAAAGQLVAALAAHGLQAKVAGIADMKRASPSDVAVAPIPAMEALRAVARVPALRLIAAGKDPEVDLPRARSLGARSFLLAPVDLELLLRAIRRCTEAHEVAKVA